jgi:hypothetical protein
VAPVPGPLLLRKSGVAWDRNPGPLSLQQDLYELYISYGYSSRKLFNDLFIIVYYLIKPLGEQAIVHIGEYRIVRL